MVEVGSLVVVFAKDTSHTLYELKFRFDARDVDTDFDISKVNPLVEHLGRNEYPVFTLPELLDIPLDGLIVF
jgi:hypothetical protein